MQIKSQNFTSKSQLQKKSYSEFLAEQRGVTLDEWQTLLKEGILAPSQRGSLIGCKQRFLKRLGSIRREKREASALKLLIR